MLIFYLTAQNVTAISSKQLQWPFYDSGSEACYPLGTETGNGPLLGMAFPVISDPNDLAKRIDNFIADTQPNSPFMGMGAKFVTAGQKYNVNPAMMIALAVKEQSLGTSSAPSNVNNHNSFGMKGIEDIPTVNGYASFPSFEASIEPANRYMAETFIQPGSTYYSTTILEMMKHYTPPSPAGSTKKTLDVMHKILDGIAIKESASATTSATVNHVFPLKKGSYNYSDDWGNERGQGTGGGGSWENAHLGNDIFASKGTPVYPVTDGVVKVIGKTDLGGNRLWLKSDDGNSYYYAHLDSYGPKLPNPGGATIGPELRVKAGVDILGYIGNTGADGSDFHLHFSASHVTYPDGPLKFVKNNEGSYDFFDQAGNEINAYKAPTDPPPAQDGPGLFNPYPFLQAWEQGESKAPANSGSSVTTPGGAGTGDCQNNTYQPGANGFELSQMVSYDQGDPKWADHPYGTDGTFNSPLRESGCGPTSLAMIGATLLGDKTITPVTIADRYGDEYHIDGGSSWALFPRFAQDYNLKIKDIGKDFGAAAQIIRNGGLVLISVDPGYFTPGGHLMVIRAVTADGSGFYLADSNGDGYNNNQSEVKAFSPNDFVTKGSLKNLWGFTR